MIVPSISHGKMKVRCVSSGVPSGAFYNAGIAYHADGSVYVKAGTLPASTVSRGGLTLTPDGAVCAVGGGTPAFWVAGIPLDSSGRVCMNPAGTVSTGRGGVPLSAAGQVCVDDRTKYLSLPGSAGNYASTPDSAANSITGDIEAIGRYAPDDATPSFADGLMYKAGNIDVRLRSDGKLQAYFTQDGTNILTAVSSAVAPFVAGTALYWKVTRASASGTVQFFTKADGGSWTQLGTDQATTAGALYDSSATLDTGRSGGSALHFVGTNSGSNQRITIPVGGTNPELDIAGDVSIEAWIKPDSGSTHADSYPMRCGTGADERYSILHNAASEALGFQWYDSAFKSVSSSAAVAPKGAVSHVVVKRESNAVSFYVNGVQITAPQAVTTPTVSAANMAIGATLVNFQQFDGVIDGPRVYNRALSDAEITEHYQGIYTDETGLVGHWPFDEGTGSTAADVSGNGNNGTLVNSPTWVAPLAVSAYAAGKAYSAQLVDGIGGTLAAEFNADDVDVNAASIVSATTGETWTVNQSGGTPAKITSLLA